MSDNELVSDVCSYVWELFFFLGGDWVKFLILIFCLNRCLRACSKGFTIYIYWLLLNHYIKFIILTKHLKFCMTFFSNLKKKIPYLTSYVSLFSTDYLNTCPNECLFLFFCNNFNVIKRDFKFKLNGIKNSLNLQLGLVLNYAVSSFNGIISQFHLFNNELCQQIDSRDSQKSHVSHCPCTVF